MGAEIYNRAARAIKTGAVAVALVIGGAVPAAGGIEILEVRINPNGEDTGNNGHLNREYVFVENTGKASGRCAGGSSTTEDGTTSIASPTAS